MTSKRWTVLTLLLTLLVGGGVVGINAWLDIYGVFRDTHGRKLPIYDTEQRAKYLLTTRYVPENFKGVLVGTSVSGNWPTGEIAVFPTYNLSTNGGNISEQRILVEKLVQRKGVEVAICLLHPFITDTHGPQTAEMDPREHAGAFGNIALLRAYGHLLAVKRGREQPAFDAFGSQDVESPAALNPTLQRIFTPAVDFTVDELAFQDYRETLALLRSRGVKVVGLVPPTSKSLLEPKRDEMARYTARMRSLFEDGELFIDMNQPAYEELRATESFYADGVHFTRSGASEVVKRVNDELARSGF
jgi:hypothetical protein